MKTMSRMTKTLTLAGALLGGASFSVGTCFGAGFDGELNKIHMTHCLSPSKKCFELKAETGESSEVQKIISMKNITLNLGTKTTESPKGYIDLENNHLVLLNRVNSGLQERVIDLKDLTEQMYVY